MTLVHLMCTTVQVAGRCEVVLGECGVSKRILAMGTAVQTWRDVRIMKGEDYAHGDRERLKE